MLPSSSLGRPFGKFTFSGVISPVSVVDEAKSDDFDLGPGLDLTFDLFKEVKNGNCLRKVNGRPFVSKSVISEC